METKETKDNMTLPFHKFEFLFMQWREIWKLRKKGLKIYFPLIP